MREPSAYCPTGKFGRPSTLAEPTQRVKTYREGRVCAHEGCGTHLSRYNPYDYCGLHEDEQWDSLLQECTEEGMWDCPQCGKPRKPEYLEWRADRKRAKDGFSPICRKCEQDDR